MLLHLAPWPGSFPQNTLFGIAIPNHISIGAALRLPFEEHFKKAK
jgi:hypothetical protein